MRAFKGIGLSTKILLLGAACVLLGELMVCVPAIARFRTNWLEERIAAAYLATLVLDPDLAAHLTDPMQGELLRRTGVLAISVRGQFETEIVLGRIVPVDRVIDLDQRSTLSAIWDTFESLVEGGDRRLRVLGRAPPDPNTRIDVIVAEAPMWQATMRFSLMTLSIALLLSLLVALLLSLLLQRMIVTPLRRLSAALSRFRERPEDVAADEPFPARADEIGFVETELARLRRDLRRALSEKTRLAALGSAMTRISHDLRNILATSVLISDRLETSEDPQVRKVAPRLIESLDRAVRLCALTLNYTRSHPDPPRRIPFRLTEVIASVRAALDERIEPVEWRIEVDPGLELIADQDQMFRVLLNLARNAIEAMGGHGGRLEFVGTHRTGGLVLQVRDTGPGLPDRIREHLFEPFAGSGKADGSGLGLAIARELVRAQGGDIQLVSTSAAGTIFQLMMPPRAVRRARLPRRLRMPADKAVSILLLLLLTGCGYRGPALAGYPGLQWQTWSFYEDRALEENATCTQPKMNASSVTQVLENTPERLVARVRYHYVDESADQTRSPGNFPGLGNPFSCAGWGSRVFTFAKRTDGGADPIAMTGPQRATPET